MHPHEDANGPTIQLSSYFSFPGWEALATAYEMEAGERATFYLDYVREEIKVYYRPTDSDDGSLTPDYDPDSAH